MRHSYYSRGGKVPIRGEQAIDSRHQSVTISLEGLLLNPTAQDRRKGVCRCLTLAEIALAVIEQRVLAGWEQATLAKEAGVTRRTIECIEGGEGANDDDLRKVALALGLLECAFIGPQYVAAAGSAETGEPASAEQMQANRLVDLQPVANADDLDRILGTHALLVDDRQVSTEYASKAATWAYLARGWAGVYSGLTTTARISVCARLLAAIRELEAEGYDAQWAAYRTDDDCDLGILLLTHESDSRCRQPRMLVPRRLDQFLRSGPQA